MTRGVRLYLVGSFVLVSLAGCGRGFFQSAEREPWRAGAEVACLKSGTVKENADLVRINPISGPGVCGAEYPLKVAALGEASGSFGFADELRPPGSIGNDQPRWPISQPAYAPPPSSYPAPSYPSSPYPESRSRQPSYGGGSNGPISLTAPGIAADEGEIELPPNGAPSQMPPRYGSSVGRVEAYPQDDRYSASRSDRYSRPKNDRSSAPRDDRGYPPQNEPYSAAPPQGREPATSSQDFSPLPRLGPSQGNPVNSFGPVAVTPTATLA